MHLTYYVAKLPQYLLVPASVS